MTTNSIANTYANKVSEILSRNAYRVLWQETIKDVGNLTAWSGRRGVLLVMVYNNVGGVGVFHEGDVPMTWEDLEKWI